MGIGEIVIVVFEEYFMVVKSISSSGTTEGKWPFIKKTMLALRTHCDQ